MFRGTWWVPTTRRYFPEDRTLRIQPSSTPGYTEFHRNARHTHHMPTLGLAFWGWHLATSSAAITDNQQRNMSQILYTYTFIPVSQVSVRRKLALIQCAVLQWLQVVVHCWGTKTSSVRVPLHLTTLSPALAIWRRINGWIGKDVEATGRNLFQGIITTSVRSEWRKTRSLSQEQTVPWPRFEPHKSEALSPEPSFQEQKKKRPTTWPHHKIISDYFLFLRGKIVSLWEHYAVSPFTACIS
jgi:hypothetical protein